MYAGETNNFIALFLFWIMQSNFAQRNVTAIWWISHFGWPHSQIAFLDFVSRKI